MGGGDMEELMHGQALMNAANSPIKLRILVIDNDTNFLALISGFLNLLRHEVVAYRNPIQALSALRTSTTYFDLVMTDVYLPEMDGFEVHKKIKEEFRLPLIMVSVEDRESIILKALKEGVAHYIVKPVCFNDVKNLWQFVVTANGGRRFSNIVEGIASIGGGESPSCGAISYDQGMIAASSTKNGETEKDDDDDENEKKKRKRSTNEEGKAPAAPKKPKVIWTCPLQARFLEAVHIIGLERAVPKRILEVMNVGGLTRENVASHLQKYRLFLKKIAAKIAGSKSSVEKSRYSRFEFGQRRSIFQQPRFGANLSSLNLNAASILNTRPGIRANDHEASCSNSAPRFEYARQPYQQPFMSNTNPFQPVANYSSVNGIFQPDNNAQRNWTNFVAGDVPYGLGSNVTNGLANNFGANPMQMYQQNIHQASPQLNFITNPSGNNYNNNYGTIGPIDQYNNPINYASTWNGNMGSMINGTSNNVMPSYPNNNNYGGIQMINQNPNPIVSNAGWDSATGVNNQFGGLMMNGNQNDPNQLCVSNAISRYEFSGNESSSVGFNGNATSNCQFSPIFADHEAYNPQVNDNNSSAFGDHRPLQQQQLQYNSSSVGFNGSTTNSSQYFSPIFADEAINPQNNNKNSAFADPDPLQHQQQYDPSVNASHNSCNVIVESGSSSNDLSSFLNRTEDNGHINLSDTFLKDLILESHDQEKGNQVMNSDANASGLQENAPLNKEISLGQEECNGDFMDDFKFDGAMNFMDMPSIENLSLDDDWENIMNSLWN